MLSHSAAQEAPITNHPTHQLADNIIGHSVATTWQEAQKEWVKTGETILDDATGMCACGKPHIKYVSFISNANTGVILDIGSTCISLFERYVGYDALRPYIARLAENIRGGLPRPLERWAENGPLKMSVLPCWNGDDASWLRYRQNIEILEYWGHSNALALRAEFEVEYEAFCVAEEARKQRQAAERAYLAKYEAERAKRAAEQAALLAVRNAELSRARAEEEEILREQRARNNALRLAEAAEASAAYEARMAEQAAKQAAEWAANAAREEKKRKATDARKAKKHEAFRAANPELVAHFESDEGRAEHAAALAEAQARARAFSMTP